MSRANTPRILVLDDREDVLSLVATSLRRDGFEVHAFSRGVDAVAAVFSAFARGECFDVMILDCALPHFDGFTVAKMVRMAESTSITNCRARIAALTAYPDTVGRTNLVRDAGMDEFWRKDRDINRLPELVRALAAREIAGEIASPEKAPGAGASNLGAGAGGPH